VSDFGTSAEVSCGQFGTGVEVFWVRSVLGLKCLGSEMSWVRSVCTPINCLVLIEPGSQIQAGSVTEAGGLTVLF